MFSCSSTKRAAFVFAVAAVSVAAAGRCFADLKEERMSRAYQAAMADYTAGRLDAAFDGFEKAVKSNGDNASARFQLACLQQDFRRDYLGAICNYREYLRLEESSDKAALAKDRLELCEMELAKALAEKHGIAGGADGAVDMKKTTEELAAAKRTIAQNAKELEELRKKVSVLELENSRFRNQIRNVGTDDAPKAKNESVRDILDDDESTSSRVNLKGLKHLAEDDEEQTPHKMNVAEEARRVTDADQTPRKMPLLAVEDDEGESDMRSGLAAAKALADEDDDGDSAPTILPADRIPAAKKLTETGNPFSTQAAQGGSSAEETPGKPDTYTVQDGDTLYKIARRFYGKESAWKRIRDANKAVISTDGRVNAGQTIVLP